jgi:hypothetical protein
MRIVRYKEEPILCFQHFFFLKGEMALQTSVAALLLLTTGIILACVVINYAVTIVEQTLNTENIPQLDHIKSLENNVLNQTDKLFNETQPQLSDQPSP